MKKENNNPENDPLVKKVEDHLYKDRVDLMKEAKNLLFFGDRVMHPWWMIVIVIFALVIIDSIFRYTDDLAYFFNFISDLASLYVNEH